MDRRAHGEDQPKLLTLVLALRECPDALRADLRREYGLDIDLLWSGGIGPLACADLTANLPAGSASWRRMDVPAAWTMGDWLTAMQVDQMNMWMWSNSDPKKRGRKPEPLPRPGSGRDASGGSPTGERSTRTIGVEAMSLEDMRRFMGQRFEDSHTRIDRPAEAR